MWPKCYLLLVGQKHVLPLLTFKAGFAYRDPIPSLVHCWWRCCRVGGECIVGFLACTSICVSQSFFPLFRLAFSNANGYKFKRLHQELATLEMLRENFGIQVNEATFKGIEL
ncbi:hypothetical protein DY000_02038078 [Brassica cretica]|uniref:Uncharacterized protein n=1 Tax=Brassica cretica TaxID=69181 RepID=A0ABQ7B633_BRACR|nr:hypothetical protein DY000_02038078 [Brassica cretica]